MSFRKWVVVLEDFIFDVYMEKRFFTKKGAKRYMDSLKIDKTTMVKLKKEIR